MKEEMSDYEKARRDAYTPLVERVKEEWREKVFVYALSCGIGWKAIVYKLVDEIDLIWEGFGGKKGPENWKICQVKEKMGGLRFYVETPTEGTDAKARNERTWEVTRTAEGEAWKTCERCGKPGTLAGKGHIATVCEECEKRWNDQRAQGAWPALYG
jgi:hypothetical protein